MATRARELMLSGISRKGIGCIYRVQSKHVELPEGVICQNTVGLLFDRPSLAKTAPETAWALMGDLVATAFPGHRCVCLYSQKNWQKLRNILERIPYTTKEQRMLKRLALGFEVTLSRSEPLIVPATLELYARLTGDDLLIVKNSDYMEIWARDRLANWPLA